MVLELVCFGAGKNLRDFMGFVCGMCASVFCYVFCADNLKKKKKSNLVPNPNRL